MGTIRLLPRWFHGKLWRRFSPIRSTIDSSRVDGRSDWRKSSPQLPMEPSGQQSDRAHAQTGALDDALSSRVRREKNSRQPRPGTGSGGGPLDLVRPVLVVLYTAILGSLGIVVCLLLPGGAALIPIARLWSRLVLRTYRVGYRA